MKERLLLSAFFIVTGVLAIFLAPFYSSAGMQAFEDTSDVSNSLYYILMILGFTATVLLIIKFSKSLLTPVFYALILITFFYAFLPFLGFLSIIPSIILLYILVKTKHWIAVNFSAVILGSAVTAIFGISLEPIPVIVLLAILALYDYIAVKKTGHMVSMADSISEMKIPVLFIIPAKNRDAIMGVGDAVMPNILAVSAYIFNKCLIQSSATLIAGYTGLLILMKIVERSKSPQPGLPVLNSFAIAGFIIGSFFCH